LQKQKVVRPKADVAPKKIPKQEVTRSVSSPRTYSSGHEEKPSYVRDAQVEDYSEKVAERLYEAKQAAVPVKDRLGDWKKKVEDEALGDAPTTDKDKIEERLAEAKAGPGVKDRLGGWIKKDEDSPSDKALLEERLAEAKAGAGVKDRLGGWLKKDEDSPVDRSIVEERLAEVKSSAGVKDRLGGWEKKKIKMTHL